MTEEQEQDFFAIKTKFFREIPHPKLILKAIGQIEKMFGVKSEKDSSAVSLIDSTASDSLRIHSNQVYEIKTAIAQDEKPEDLLISLNKLYQLQVALVHKLAFYLPDKTEYLMNDIKQSETIDSYALLTELNSLALPEDQIKTYICNEIETKKPVRFSKFTRACIQCKKISANAGSHESFERTTG